VLTNQVGPYTTRPQTRRPAQLAGSTPTDGTTATAPYFSALFSLKTRAKYFLYIVRPSVDGESEWELNCKAGVGRTRTDSAASLENPKAQPAKPPAEVSQPPAGAGKEAPAAPDPSEVTSAFLGFPFLVQMGSCCSSPRCARCFFSSFGRVLGRFYIGRIGSSSPGFG
jgi:hypothetical protein